MARPDMTGKLRDIFDDLAGHPAQSVLEEHLLGGTPAAQIARWLRESGFDIGATTIKEYRALTREEVGKCE